MDRDRRTAFLILKVIQEKASYSQLTINSVLSSEGADNPAFVREIVYGVLRNQILLDYQIAAFLKSPKLKTNEKILLRMGFYQLIYMDSVSDYAAVSETVELASNFIKGKQGFINSVLRNFVRSGKKINLPEPKDKAEYLSVKYSCSKDIVLFWMKAYGEGLTEAILINSNRPGSLGIRINPLKNSGLTEEKVLSLKNLISSDEYRRGEFSIQGKCSQLAVKRLDPKPGSRLIDLCAAPGGKSCAAAELMENKGEILSFDFYEKRAALVSKEARRLGLDIIKASQADASVLKSELLNTADYVICDVPCSGFGTIAKKPEIKLKGIDPEMWKLPIKQLKILENGSRYLKTGGRLLYSSCTISPYENEELVNKFINGNPKFEIESSEQIFPSEKDSDGFYIAIIRRIND